MHSSNSKFLLSSCCHKFFTSHSLLKNQNLFSYKKSSKISNKSAQQLTSFSTYSLQNKVQNGEQVNSSKQLFEKISISCKRHYDKYLNSNKKIENNKTRSNQKSTGCFKKNDLYLAQLSSSNKQSTQNNFSESSNQTNNNQQRSSEIPSVRTIYRNNLFNLKSENNNINMSNIPFKPKKALILTKFSRLEYERRILAGCSEEEIKENLIRRGSDYESLLNHHNIHNKSKEHVAKTLEEFGIEHRIVNRFEYNQEQIDWADVIITTGGDGTFLMAASKIFNNNKLVIGINSDPSRSVGYLCLQPNYSINFKPALEKLASGNFRWVYRQRIRVSIKGENSMDAPAELHDQQLLHPEFRYLDLETHPLNRRSNSPARPDIQDYKYNVLPVRALNDVFVGECLSSRVSYFELKIEDKPFIKVKSSGVTVCTGTGSTSWSFNINKISPQSISTLFKIINQETNSNLDALNEELSKNITKKFNDSLIFDVCKDSMAYTVRDPVFMGNGFDSDNRGFAKDIVVKSRMFDACVVIDGGLSYKFNDGAYAKFEILEEDQLKTVAF